MLKLTRPLDHFRNLCDLFTRATPSVSLGESDQILCSVIGALAYPQGGLLVRAARLMLLIEHYWLWTLATFRMGGLKAVCGRVRRRLEPLFTARNRQVDSWGSDLPTTKNFQENQSQGMQNARAVQSTQELRWFVDELICFRDRVYAKGWAFCPGKRIVTVSLKLPSGRYCDADGYGLESQDVERMYGSEGRNCRFAFASDVPGKEVCGSITLVFATADGARFEIKDPTLRTLNADPFNRAGASFWEKVQAMTGGSVLEIGSRNRSGIVRKGLVPSSLEYTGFDVVPGNNVDVVGDAHFLSRYFPPNKFNVVFAYSVFEHLLMPWKVVIEMNRLMKPGGIVMVTTHQTWPLHEEPWDFWRFSSHTWSSLFNRETGFQVVEAAMGELASVVPHVLNPVVAGLDQQPCCLGSIAVARKVGDTRLQWDVDPALLLAQEYPK